jgi:hypothetical protein
LPLQVEDGRVRAVFVAVEGARERLALTWHLSYEDAPPVEDADSALARTGGNFPQAFSHLTPILAARISTAEADPELAAG